MSDKTRHNEVVVVALRWLGREPANAPLSVRLLAGGLSGSSVYRLDSADEVVVLKVTAPSEHRQVLARARREALFYRDLAARVPVLVPRVLGLDLEETDGVVILLAAYEPSPLPDEWTEHTYAQVAHELGQLHATFWGKTETSALPEWLQAKPPVTLVHCREAASIWRALGERSDLREALRPFCRRLERLVMEIPELDPRLNTLPATLCHGDCHIGNLLQDPAGEWIWADWQEVRLGPGVDDLTFLGQRAFVAAETSPPYEAMVRAYGVGLESVGGALVTQEQLDRSLAWADLRSWLVDWPGYLGAVSSARMERVLGRIESLIGQLEIADQ